MLSKKVNILVSLVAFSHFACDFCQGSLGLIIPLLKEEMNLDYFTASLVVFLYDLGLAVFPVMLGAISDRLSNNLLLPIGCFLSGIGLILTSISSSLGGVFLGVILAGIGLSAAHSEGAKQTYLIGKARPGLSMSLFALGGNAGFSIAPIVAGLIAVNLGRQGFTSMTIPAFLGGILLFSLVQMFRKHAGNSAAGNNFYDIKNGEKKNLWGPLSLLSIFVVLRSGIHHSLAMLIPLYCVEYFNLDSFAAGKAVSFYLLIGIIAAPLGGVIAEVVGEKRILLASFLFASPLLLLLPYVSYYLMLIFLFILGILIMSNFGLTPALAQLYVPEKPGTAVGIVNGFAVGIGGGLGVLLVGLLSNHFGLRSGISLLALMAASGVLVSFFLPEMNLNTRISLNRQ